MFSVNQRVESHPATDAWIFGDRYGTVVKVGRKYVHVKMDRSGRTLRFTPENLLELPDWAGPSFTRRNDESADG